MQYTIKMMVWMLYLVSSNFSDQFRHIIYQILIYRFVNMNYSILNEKENKLKFILMLFEFTIIIIIYSLLFYLSNCLKFKT
jgi:hypothetical protein